MLETEANDQDQELHTIEHIKTSDIVEATYESEKINSDDLIMECDKDEGIDESMLGKVSIHLMMRIIIIMIIRFYMDLASVKTTQLKTRQQMRLTERCMYATKKVSNGWKRMIWLEMRKNGVEMLEPDAKQCFELQDKRTGSGWWTRLITHTITT
ncbi:hypothetical protein LXL04_013495 [Taraxacum kok-saghyz]